MAGNGFGVPCWTYYRSARPGRGMTRAWDATDNGNVIVIQGLGCGFCAGNFQSDG